MKFISKACANFSRWLHVRKRCSQETQALSVSRLERLCAHLCSGGRPAIKRGHHEQVVRLLT